MADLRILVQLICMLPFLASTAWCQPQNGPRPPSRTPFSGERDPFFEAWREAMQESIGREIFEMLEYSEIRAEIGLAGDVMPESPRIMLIRKFNELHQDAREQEKTKEQLKSAMLSVLSSIDRQYQEILAQNNADIKRLLGLYAQWRGYRATLNELVAKEIGISDGQLHALREFRNKTAWRLFEDSKQDMERAYRKDLSFREREKEIREIRKQLEERFDAALAGELSTEQKHKLEQLKGEKFNLPERLTDYNFPPGRGRRGDDRERDHDNRERKDEDNIKSSPGASDSLLRESPSNEREKNPPCGPPENTRAAISSR